MSLKCLFGHKWSTVNNKCFEKCSVCGKGRFMGHNWRDCKCERCGETRDEGHKWIFMEGKCIEKCSICAKERPLQHKWDGCVCSVCGETRFGNHVWQGKMCCKCGLPKVELVGNGDNVFTLYTTVSNALSYMIKFGTNQDITDKCKQLTEIRVGASFGSFHHNLNGNEFTIPELEFIVACVYRYSEDIRGIYTNDMYDVRQSYASLGHDAFQLKSAIHEDKNNVNSVLKFLNEQLTAARIKIQQLSDNNPRINNKGVIEILDNRDKQVIANACMHVSTYSNDENILTRLIEIGKKLQDRTAFTKGDIGIIAACLQRYNEEMKTIAETNPIRTMELQNDKMHLITLANKLKEYQQYAKE